MGRGHKLFPVLSLNSFLHTLTARNLTAVVCLLHVQYLASSPLDGGQLSDM